MNFIQLEYFKKTAECGNITMAAKKMFVSQPAVSKQLKLLEEELECKLFARRGNRLALTLEGELFLKHAKEIVSKVKNIKDEINFSRKKVSGKLAIGCGAVSAKLLLPNIVDKMIKEYPDVEVSIFEAETNEMRELLESDVIDISFSAEDLRGGSEKKIEFKEIFSSELVLVCSEKCALARMRKVSFEEIKKYPLITYTPDTGVYRVLVKALLENARIILQSRYSETMLVYIEKNLGVGIIPEYIARLKSLNGIVVRKLDTDIKIHMGINHDVSKPLSPAARIFIELLSAEYGK
ncbi:MAG: hypothetical protein A2017_06850 [Lentisphaerae bacterium GWF2_44_16]|nr:MAG: hypothetical protein A2017_06850 [Lentisphaerae bacterium GWF2_44_16]